MEVDDKKKIEKSRAEKENKVEYKTCPFCQNQVATTWMGLKRHVRKMHPEKLDIKPSRLGRKKEQKEKVIYTLRWPHITLCYCHIYFGRQAKT